MYKRIMVARLIAIISLTACTHATPASIAVPSATVSHLQLPKGTQASTSALPSAKEQFDNPVTPTPIPTSPPLPTLSPEDSRRRIEELMKTNGNCSKPCFWGVMPGLSNFEEATNFIDSLGKKALTGYSNSFRYYNVILPFKKEGIIDMIFWENEGIVQSLYVRVDGLQDPGIKAADWIPFRPDSILTAYGVPSTIEVALSEGQNGFISYQLLFSYDDPHLEILYTPEDSTYRPSTTLHTCPMRKNKISRFDLSIKKPLEGGLYSIVAVTHLSTTEFSSLLMEKKEQACFNLDLNILYK